MKNEGKEHERVRPDVRTIGRKNKVVRFWVGNVSGTNRGRIVIRAVSRGSDTRAVAWLDDQVAGRTGIWMIGGVEGREMNLRITRSSGLAPLLPLDGGVRITLDESLRTGQGDWTTDVGTSGSCRLVDGGRMGWWWRMLTVPVQHAAARVRGFAYTLLLLGVAGLSVADRVELTWQGIVLLLVPVPFVFQAQILRLIAALKIRRIGPVELQEQNAPTESIAHAISEQVQLEVRFQVLDLFFVPRTKLVLMILAATGVVNRSQFKVIAGQVGVPDENIDTTLEAVVSTGCATVNNEKVAITEFGRRYVGHLNPVART